MLMCTLSTLLLLIALALPGFCAEPVRVVALGDSITKGVRPGVTAEQTFAALVQARLKQAGVEAEVANVGIGGERTDQALKRLEKDVLSRRPAVVTIMYGTNDSYVDRGKSASRISLDAYEANLRELVARLREAKIVPVLMTEPRWGKSARLNGAGEHPNVRLEKYVAACRRVAAETKTPLVDNFKHWSTQEDDGVNIGDWTTDQCHPNPAGHRVIAESMLPVLLKVLGEEQ